MDKQHILNKLEDALDKLEDIDKLNLNYGSISVVDYAPDNSKYDKKYSYRQFDVQWNDKTQDFDIIDTSEPFVCSMGASDCTERGYCNGDC